MNVIINGKGTEFEDGLSVTSLLKMADVEMPEYVSVQLRGEILERAAFDSTIVKDGDAVEFLYYMGGGANVDI
jgi:sulfur carrier protein